VLGRVRELSGSDSTAAKNKRRGTVVKKHSTKAGKSTKKIKSMPLSAKKAKGVKGGSFSFGARGTGNPVAEGWIENASFFDKKI
jgi:hypothetical protein